MEEIYNVYRLYFAGHVMKKHSLAVLKFLLKDKDSNGFHDMPIYM